MTAPPATASGAGNPLDAVQQLQGVVNSLAPALRPQVLPKGAAYGLDLLLQQCATDEQRAALRALVHQNKPAAGTDDNEDSMAPFVVGAFDVEKKVFSIDKIEWLGQEDALVHQFPRFIELQLESPDEVRAGSCGTIERGLSLTQTCVIAGGGGDGAVPAGQWPHQGRRLGGPAVLQRCLLSPDHLTVRGCSLFAAVHSC